MLLTLRKALHRSAFFIALSFIVLSITGLPLPVSAACTLPAVEREALVSGVVDGDTLRFADGNSVRLIGVNTPELGRDGRPDQPGAQAAFRKLKGWVQGKTVGVVRGLEPRDRYGRLLAHLSLGGESLSERLVERGLGFALAIPPDLRLSDCLFLAERRARDARLGLWQSNPVVAASSVSSGGFAVLKGRVTKLESSRSALYAEVDDHLVLRVDRKLLDAGSEDWLLSTMGRTFEMRGWVVDRGANIKPGRKRWLIGVSDLRHLRLIEE